MGLRASPRKPPREAAHDQRKPRKTAAQRLRSTAARHLRPRNSMLYGTIVTFFNDKKFGFITSDTGRDIFFHVSVLEAGETQPEIKTGQPVKYELAPREPKLEDTRRDNKRRSEQRIIERLGEAALETCHGPSRYFT